MKKVFWICPALIFACLPVSVHALSILPLVYETADTLAPGAMPGRLSPDGLRFIGGLVEEDGRELLYRWERAALGNDWGEPQLIAGELGEIPDSANNMQPAISADGRLIVFVRNSTDLWENNDMYTSRNTFRNTPPPNTSPRNTQENTPLPFNNVGPLDELNTSKAEAYPYLSADGRRLYYVTDEGLMVSKHKKGEFGEPELVQFQDNPSIISVWISADERSIVISDGTDLFYAQRKSLKKPFGELVPLSLPPDLGFISSPSFDSNGYLYLYSSVEVALEDPGESEGIIEGLLNEDEEGWIDEKNLEESSVNMILILKPKGGN